VILPQSGHFFPLEVPEAANRAILDFLQGTPTAA
jgi:pimeloyl-ACP methyl ester carboxylesterase